MQKILVVNDPHVSDKAPARRTDTYPEDILEKLKECVSLCNSKDLDGIFLLGDLFHIKAASRVSHYIVNRVMSIFRACTKPIHIIPGNHDLSSGRLESLSKQPLGVVSKLDNVFVHTKGFSLGEFSFQVAPGVAEFMGEFILDGLEKLPSSDFLLAHTIITPMNSTFPSFVPHISSTNNVFSKWSGVIYGHIHDDHGFYTVGNTWFCNHGSISRGVLDEKTLKRVPKVAILHFKKEGCFAEPLELSCAKPAEDVFRIMDKEEEDKKRLDAEEFLNSIVKSSISMTTKEGVSSVIMGMDIDEDVKTVAVEILESVEEY